MGKYSVMKDSEPSYPWESVILSDGKKLPNSGRTTANTKPNSGGEESGKEQRDLEKFTIYGDGSLEPNMKLRAKKTVEVRGLGRYLSAAYFVEQVKTTWSRSGVKQSLTLSKPAVSENVLNKYGSNNKSYRKTPVPKK